MQRWPLLLSLVVLWLVGCRDGEAIAGGATGAGGEGGGSVESAFLTILDSPAAYSSVAGDHAEVKYLATARGADAPTLFDDSGCLFQDTARYSYHLRFLRAFPEYSSLSLERYTDLVLRRSSRVMWGGGLKLLAAPLHPLTRQTGRAGVHTVQ